MPELVRTMFGDEAIQLGFLTDAYYDVMLCGIRSWGCEELLNLLDLIHYCLCFKTTIYQSPKPQNHHPSGTKARIRLLEDPLAESSVRNRSRTLGNLPGGARCSANHLIPEEIHIPTYPNEGSNRTASRY